MVFFNCNACGESLKKNQVEKHYNGKCRNCEVLSCMDCGKEFWGEAYQEHTKCISEDQKYGGKDYKPKTSANKGEAKQELWIQQVQEAIDKAQANPRLQQLLERIKDYPNIPRKKAKFENFIRNSLNTRDGRLVTEAWDLFSAVIEEHKQAKQKSAEQEKDTGSTGEMTPIADTEDKKEVEKLSKREKKEERKKKRNKDEKKDKKKKDKETAEEEEAPKKKSKKRKHCDESEAEEEVAEEQEEVNGSKKKKKKNKQKLEEATNGKNSKAKKRKRHEDEEDELTAKNIKLDDSTTSDSVPAQKFKWDTVIIEVLEKADDNELSIKRLKKKVMCEYAARGGDNSGSEQKVWAKFDKKVKHNPRIRVLKDRVKLVS